MNVCYGCANSGRAWAEPLTGKGSTVVAVTIGGEGNRCKIVLDDISPISHGGDLKQGMGWVCR